eukprot:CAMPEP_0184425186 /NCGR_PEP_ID=MMETSP0738-20130409/127295_1 /TAXON_ID=385413 /ORGANISM="Thalassiosira miniscula, Strain CCMP1093" /LENGTH=70 /DNA_ID=CAMNT_0026787947 /DNA_START=217 /DNA_END=429 /DNA_ORIENTATION=-
MVGSSVGSSVGIIDGLDVGSNDGAEDGSNDGTGEVEMNVALSTNEPVLVEDAGIAAAPSAFSNTTYDVVL